MKKVQIDPVLLAGLVVTGGAIFSGVLWAQQKDQARMLAESKVNWLAAGRVSERARMRMYKSGAEALMDFELEKILVENQH